jgi:hypothetical protein
MWTKEIAKCYHLWINPQLLENLTHVCCFFQDNGKQTVFVSYKQQQTRWSLFIDRYLLIQSSTDTFFYRNMHQLLPQFVVSVDRSERHVVVKAKHEQLTMNCFSLLV